MSYGQNHFSGEFDRLRDFFADNERLYFGNDRNVYMEFDGTNFRIVADNVTPSDIILDAGTDKTLLLQETVYDDQQVDIGSVAKGVSEPVETPYKGSVILAFAENQDNEINFIMQLSHRYKLDTPVEFHVHGTVPDNTAGDVKFEFTVSKADIGADFPEPTPYIHVESIPANSQDHHFYVDIADNVGSSSGVSSFWLCSLKRLGTDAEDTYANDFYLVGLDFHFQIDTLGSREETTK